MFLTERVVSLITYAFALFVTYRLIGKLSRKQYKTILIIYLLILALFAFNYKPYITADLYRLREYIKYWIYKDSSEVINYAFQCPTPIWVLYSYIISKLGNANWLQTVTCIWCFGNVFYIISHEIERQEIEGIYRSQLFFYIMSIGAFYLQTISDIRSMLGISIVAFCLYRETVGKRSIIKHLFLWLFAALLHTSTMILVISRFLFLLIQIRSVVKRIVMASLIFILAVFSFRYLGNYIVNSFEYGRGYINNTKEYTYVWEVIIGLLENFETIYVLRTYRKNMLNRRSNQYGENYGYRSLYLFTLVWTAISIVALPLSYAIFRRYTMLCTATSIPLVARLFQINKQDENRKTSTFKIIFALSFLIFALSGIRGDLCGYKFFSIR